MIGFASVAGAGERFQTLEVVKEIVGPVPPGAEFAVEVQCEGQSGPTIDETLTFTESGSQIVDLTGGSLSCSVEETEAAGATVTYACEAVSASTCTSDRTITNQSDIAASIVTVTNTYVPEPEPAPLALELEPSFTG